MRVLDRQPVPGSATGPASTLPPSLQGLPPRSVPETAPTPLQKHYVLLSVPVLILGAIAITALELGVPLEDQRVRDRLEAAAGGVVGEDDAAKSRPVAVPLGRQQLLTELLDHLGQPRRTAGHHLTSQRVAVDQDRTELDQELGHRALPRGNTSCQTDAHGPSVTGWSSTRSR